MDPEVWADLAELIALKYNDFDGFVILHGSDTMSFTASALSYVAKSSEASGINRFAIADRRD